MSVHRSIAAASVVLACALVGCGGKNDYPASAEHNFLTACQRSGPKDFCQCSLDKIEENMSYDDFKKEDTAIRAGNKPSRKLTDAVSECRQ